MKKKILLTGSTGYVGSIIYNHLKQSNSYEIETAGRNKGESIYLNILKPNEILEKNFANKIDILVHAAALNEVKSKENITDAYQANVISTRIIAECIIKKKVEKIIYISTFHVYGEKKGLLNEEVIPKPLNDYGMTHYQAEQILLMLGKKYNVEINILRLANLFCIPLKWDTFRRWNLVPFDFIKQAIENKKIVINSDGKIIRNFISEEWLRYAIDEALANNLSTITNITGKPLQIIEVAEIVADIVGKKLNFNISINLGKEENKEEQFSFESNYLESEIDLENKNMTRKIIHLVELLTNKI
jgi:UDP-glucose 4-epimerase